MKACTKCGSPTDRPYGNWCFACYFKFWERQLQTNLKAEREKRIRFKVILPGTPEFIPDLEITPEDQAVANTLVWLHAYLSASRGSVALATL